MHITERPNTPPPDSIESPTATAQATEQSEGWGLGRRIRQIPRHLVQRLVDRFSMQSICTLCTFSSLIFVYKITDRLISPVVPSSYFNNILFKAGLVILEWTLIKYLGDALYRSIENHAQLLLDDRAALTIPNQTLDTIFNGTRCPESVGNRIKKMLRNNQLPSRHFKQLTDLYTQLLNEKHLCSGVELNKMRRTLDILTSHPDILPPIATHIINQMGRCEDNMLSLLDQTYYRAIASSSIHQMEHLDAPNWDQWLHEIRKMYHEHCFNETLRLMSSTGSSHPSKVEDNLVQHEQSVMIYNIYKKILHEAGTCDFMTVPSKINHYATECHWHIPSSKVFYKFEQEMQKRVANKEAFRLFATRTISEIRESVSATDSILTHQLKSNEHTHFQQLEALEECLTTGSMTEAQYNHKAVSLMKSYEEQSDILWEKHLNDQIQTFLNRSAPLSSSVSPGLSMRQLIRRYNKDYPA